MSKESICPVICKVVVSSGGHKSVMADMCFGLFTVSSDVVEFSLNERGCLAGWCMMNYTKLSFLCIVQRVGKQSLGSCKLCM